MMAKTRLDNIENEQKVIQDLEKKARRDSERISEIA